MIESISFVIPTYRTADTLPELIDQIDAVAPTFAHRHSIVVIDDACPERSGQAVAGRAGTTVHRFETNRGQRAAVLAGLARADADVACVLDADLQDDPVAVRQLVAELEASGADVVCAGRRGAYESTIRRTQAWIFRRLRWVMSRGRIPPDAGVFHVATAGAVRGMLVVASPGDDPPVAYARSGARIVSIPVERRPRPTGTSSYSAVDRLRMAGGSLGGLLAGSRRSCRPQPSIHEPEHP